MTEVYSLQKVINDYLSSEPDYRTIYGRELLLIRGRGFKNTAKYPDLRIPYETLGELGALVALPTERETGVYPAKVFSWDNLRSANTIPIVLTSHGLGHNALSYLYEDGPIGLDHNMVSGDSIVRSSKNDLAQSIQKTRYYRLYVDLTTIREKASELGIAVPEQDALLSH